MVDIRAGGTADAYEYIHQLAELFERDFFDASIRDDYSEAFNLDRFREKILDQYSARPGFALITLWSGKELAGFIFGSSLPPESRWWKTVKQPLPDDFTAETGSRTFAIYDFLVGKDYRQQGYGRQLHDALVKDRPEERITLLSSKPQQPAHTIFLRWGYRIVAAAEPIGTGIALDVFLRSAT